MRRSIDVTRLRRAMNEGGLTPYRLAKRARLAHSTLSRLFGLPESRRITQQVTSGTLTKLATALGVREEWLTGETDRLSPFLPKHGLLEDKGPSDEATVTAAWLRLSHFLQQVDDAVQRDLRAWFASDADTVYQKWGRVIVDALHQLTQAWAWRTVGVRAIDQDPGVFLDLDNTPVVEWLTRMLLPWFEGRAYLNAEGLRALSQTFFAGPDKKYQEPIAEAAALAALGLYENARREHAP